MTQDTQAGYLRSRLDVLRTDFSGYAGALIALAVGVHVAAACFHGGFLNADEHYQIIEFAQQSWPSVAVTLPWEFAAQIRPALQPWLVVVLIRLCRVFGVTTPFTIAFLLRLLSALLRSGHRSRCVRCIRTVEARWISGGAVRRVPAVDYADRAGQIFVGELGRALLVGGCA
jgi:hypothetical protein